MNRSELHNSAHQRPSTWTRWQMPVMSDTSMTLEDSTPPSAQSMMSQGMLDEVQQQARREGWERGLQEGRMAAQGEQKLLAARWHNLLNGLVAPLDKLDGDVEMQLMELAISLAKQLAKREISDHPEVILDVLRAALSALPAGQHHVQVHLHPEDAHLVREYLENDSDHKWKLIESTDIQRGGTLVTTDVVRIDERLETRMERLVAQLLDQAHAGPSQSHAA